MSETDRRPAPPRPRQVTVSGIVAAVGCALLLISLFDASSQVRSAEMRRGIAEQLAGRNDLGLTVADVVDLLRVVVLLSAALAAAGLVMSVFVLRRHRASRVGLSVIAVLLLFSATFVVGLLPVLVAFAAGRLWSREAREWFDDRRPATADAPGEGTATSAPPRATWPSSPPPAPPTTGVAPPAGQPAQSPPAQSPPAQSPPAQSPAQAPPAEPGPPPAPYAFGTPPPRPDQVSSPAVPSQPRTQAQTGAQTGAQTDTRTGAQTQAQPYRSWPPAGSRRPVQVTSAAWLTWVACSLAALMFLLLAVTLTANAGSLVDELQRNPRVSAAGLSEQDIIGALWVGAAVGLFWSLAAIALAVLAFRRVASARIALIVSAGLSVPVGLVAVPVGWLNAAAAVATMVLLLRGDVHRWYAGRDRAPHHPTGRPTHPPAQHGPPPPPPGGSPPVW